MEQKLVTYKVAKALKEAGYPQGLTTYRYLTKETEYFNEGTLMDSFGVIAYVDNTADATTYIDAWLWLWREKGIMIDTLRIEDCVEVSVYTDDLECLYIYDQVYPDPEEAIANAIDYLVENNLIK